MEGEKLAGERGWARAWCMSVGGAPSAWKAAEGSWTYGGCLELDRIGETQRGSSTRVVRETFLGVMQVGARAARVVLGAGSGRAAPAFDSRNWGEVGTAARVAWAVGSPWLCVAGYTRGGMALLREEDGQRREGNTE